MSKRRKQPRVSVSPVVKKKPRAEDFPEGDTGDGKVHFRFRYFDADFRPKSKDQKNSRDAKHCFYTIAGKLRNFADGGWKVLDQNRKKHHSVAIERLAPDAQNRLVSLKYDDLDSVFSLRLTSTQRLFGIRSGDALYALWWDPDHQICPSKKRHT